MFFNFWRKVSKNSTRVKAHITNCKKSDASIKCRLYDRHSTSQDFDDTIVVTEDE